jgi:hypothetical protein
MIHVPEIDQLTQARRIDEIVPMAESLIAVSTDQPLTDINVRIMRIDVPGLGDIAARAGAIEAARNAAVQAAEAAQHDAAAYVRALAKAGVPVRDTADLLHLSPQRVSQLTNAGRGQSHASSMN